MKKRPPLTKGQLRPKALRTKAGVVVEFCRGINGTDPIVRDGKPQVAFVGRSNVGKSSTINAILGTTIARASARPGKTTEINFFSVMKDGDPEHLATSERRGGYVVDLPGYGYARMGGAAHEKIRKHVLWYLSSGEAMPKMLVLVLDARVGAYRDCARHGSSDYYPRK
jgi:GTP-binding protein